MHCLLIEDNTANAYLVEVLLTRRGHCVNVARTGAEAVAMSRLQRFDVILIDLKLPDGDGCAFVPQLASGAWGGRPAPVIAVSAPYVQPSAVCFSTTAVGPMPVPLTPSVTESLKR